ncbi:MAG: hypothetical protein IPH69_01555 [Bacteroidales bacterium]|nr:hypothetical protein [Bacteroidales bacterium]
MNSISKIAKGLIDIVTIVAMIGCWVTTESVKGHRGGSRSEQEIANSFSWGTLHSIFSIVFSLLIIIHLFQHWKFIKGMVLKSLYSKNIVTTITLITFIVTVVSFLVYLTGFNDSKGEFHGTVANIFLISGCVHLVLNLKKFLSLFEGILIREGSLLHDYITGIYTPGVETVLTSLFKRDDKLNR